MTTPDHATHRPTTRRHHWPFTRPRWIWGGLLTAIAGMIVAGVGVAATSWIWSLVGAGTLLAGVGLAFAGGVLYDAHSGPPTEELKHVLQGGTRAGVAAGQTRSTPGSRRRARAVEARLDQLEAATAAAPRPYPVKPPAVILMLIALFLLVSQWELYPLEFPGQTNANRALGCAILFAACGLRIRFAQPLRRRRPSAGLAGVAGLALLCNGLLSPHDRLIMAVLESLCGLLAVLCAGVVFAYRPHVDTPDFSDVADLGASAAQESNSSTRDELR
ncbi:hypothetical protein [Nocardioides sp. MH1]|uniref:hypothetical protein n=1 Tax=Nocardioides sp. MH1 TaxID=3242490 RepID=UPI0035205F63